ncbi:enoyl-CoA hydratase/isomerase family protein [Pseudomonadota bacterium]
MEFKAVSYSTSNRVATILLNRPEAMNAFETQLRLDLMAAITQAGGDDDVRVIVISGAGRGFSSGADLQHGIKPYDTFEAQMLAEYKPFLMAIHNSPKLFISAINGPCAGIATALAMACDLTVMAEDAYLYQAFAAIGLVPDGGACWHLVRAIGYKRALQAFVECEKITARDCLQLGLANHVVAADELMPFAQSWAEKLAAGSPLAQRYTKELLKQAMSLDLPEVIDQEAKTQITTSTSQDALNAVEAFFKKEKPRFQGR